MSVRLTGRQRDFIASYPNDTVTELQQHGDAVLVEASEGVHDAYTAVYVPVTGFIDQPKVVLEDWEEELSHIPERALDQDQILALRGKRLDDLPVLIADAFFQFKDMCDRESIAADWDEILRVLHEGRQGA